MQIINTIKQIPTPDTKNIIPFIFVLQTLLLQ
jgi:hypothetical protein